MPAAKSYLDPEEVHQVVDILQRERAATALSRRERVAGRWLVILGLQVTPALLLTSIVSFVIGVRLPLVSCL